MKTILRSILPTFIIFLSFFLVLSSPVIAQTQDWTEINYYCVGRTEASADVATIQGFGCLIVNIFSVAIGFIGFAGFAMLVVGSFRYLLSGGNAKGTETARNTMTFAIVGLVVALSAFIILRLIAQFTGVGTIMQFVIPDSNSGFNGAPFPAEEPVPQFDPKTGASPKTQTRP